MFNFQTIMVVLLTNVVNRHLSATKMPPIRLCPFAKALHGYEVIKNVLLPSRSSIGSYQESCWRTLVNVSSWEPYKQLNKGLSIIIQWQMLALTKLWFLICAYPYVDPWLRYFSSAAFSGGLIDIFLLFYWILCLFNKSHYVNCWHISFSKMKFFWPLRNFLISPIWQCRYKRVVLDNGLIVHVSRSFYFSILLGLPVL